MLLNGVACSKLIVLRIAKLIGGTFFVIQDFDFLRLFEIFEDLKSFLKVTCVTSNQPDWQIKSKNHLGGG